MKAGEYRGKSFSTNFWKKKKESSGLPSRGDHGQQTTITHAPMNIMEMKMSTTVHPSLSGSGSCAQGIGIPSPPFKGDNIPNIYISQLQD